MNLDERIDKAQLSYVARYFISLVIAVGAWYLSRFVYAKNEIIMPIWQRDYSNIWHGLTGFGHTQTQTIAEIPSTVVGVIAISIVGFAFFKQLFKYPERLNFVTLLIITVDFLMLSVVVRIFVTSGTMTDLLYYGLSFGAGAYIFGNRMVGQGALVIFGVFVLTLRLILNDDLYIYGYWIPLLFFLYIVLRSPLAIEDYKTQIKNHLDGRP